MHNCKLIEYPTGLSRLKFYERPVFEGKKRKPKKVKTPFGTWATEAPHLFKDDPGHEAYKERSKQESMKRTKNKLYDIAMANSWDWFLTLTFDKEKVDRYDYNACAKAMKTFLKYARRRNPDIKYVLVAELHQDGAFHFHGLFANCPDLPMTDSGHKDKKGRIIYNVDGYKYGFSTVTKVTDSNSAASYMTKYITKSLCAVVKRRKRYWASRNVSLPVVHKLMLSFPDKELAFNTIFADCRYYKEIGNEEYRGYLFEFDAGHGYSLEDFLPYRILYPDGDAPGWEVA